MKTKACPYPGLRPFTQEESIFFKGRELHVRQVINQLEERKFVLVTGASGDGKSSLIYAGVIPNALAGFFRAEYNNWLFIDFRPERDPIGNLTKSLADKMDLLHEEVSEKLQYGFASLVNIYKSSRFYVNQNSDEWKQADDREKKHAKNNAANLLILADQFEEFFTNQENYNNGRPSTDAYTTVNLLLETARIAIKEKLPIYIVFTMRSDYISQCVAFKNLPEFIGFSQFFVPRLKRNEMQQVIEEPALLSGGKISKRLTEVLINELRDGFDQLPVLQHCLNSLWHLADDGNIELDLIHLVKAAGMDAKLLNKEDFEIFEEWFSSQENYIKDFYNKPSLNNVLNSHANILYITAFSYFNENADWAEKNITLGDAQFIIKTTFQCLTKIDEGRSVRNRMTLSDIARIINKKHITTDIICGVMNIFRLPSNTFIRPFIDPEDIATQYLPADSIWDITHEALIRNWELLNGWEDEEEQNLSNFNDFQTQLQRWVDHDRSTNFLLSAGNLNHFEEWYAKSNLNKYWILKYDNSEISIREKTENADKLALLSKEFLEESRQNVLKIEKAKQRNRRIISTVAIALIAILTGFTSWALKEKAYAQKQEVVAVEQTKKTKEENRKAELAQKEAEKNAKMANKARLQSEEARNNAEKMRRLADEKALLAMSESKKAQKEKQRADKQLIITREQKGIAEAQRKKAELATQNANRLSYLAIAQSLTFKADKNYANPQINLLLAYQAYLFNKNNGGNKNDPEIFQALTAAQDHLGISPVIMESQKTISTMSVKSENAIDIFDADGSYYVFNLKTGKETNKKDFTSTVPVNSAFIIPDHILASYENYDAGLWNIQNGFLQSLGDQSNFIRSAIYLTDKNWLITGNRDNKVKIFNVAGKSPTSIKTIDLGARITKLVSNPQKGCIYIACSNGKIMECSLNNFKLNEVTDLKNIITDLAISADEKKLVAATANGEIRVINLSDNSTSDFEVSQAMIDAVAIDNRSKLLSVSSADKKIRIYQLANPNLKPFYINSHKQRSKVLGFSPSGKLFALGFDNKIRCWETNVDTLTHQIKGKITRDLTVEEWKKFVGKGVDYQKVNK